MTEIGPHLFIDGRFRSASEVEPVFEAATGTLLGHGPNATVSDIDDAVGAARRALQDWKTTPMPDRALALERMADAMEARAEATAELCSREMGAPITYSRIVNGATPAAVLRYYAALIHETNMEEIRRNSTGFTLVRREPVGVVGAVVPWNVPQALAATKFGPALAVGCTVVLKPAPETALDARVLGEAAAEAGLPPGVLNVVGGGDQAGAFLVRHPSVDKVAFTGSTQVGARIAETCGRLLRPVTLELGGKSAAIILEDADLDLVMRELRTVSFGNNGQLCFANTRVLAPRSRYSEVIDALADMAQSLAVGDPLDDSVDIGPLVNSRQQERVLTYIAIGKADGARLVTGGGVPVGRSRGWYVAPTVFADVNNSSRLAREEIFGPVVSVIPYDSSSDAINIANDSDFGLGGTVWSSDEAWATEIACAIDTGTIGINQYRQALDAPFGGVKKSGLGREFGPEGLTAYQTLKSIFRTGVPDLSIPGDSESGDLKEIV